MITKPMLAAKLIGEGEKKKSASYDMWPSQIRFPVLATPKIDGIRCETIEGDALSRTLKPIPNIHIRNAIKSLSVDGLDGELVKYPVTNFQDTMSAVMTRDGVPDFRYCVFDYYWASHPRNGKSYSVRVSQLMALNLPNYCQLILPTSCNTMAELLDFEDTCILSGYEGVCFRTPESPYKFGRSTWRQQWLVKMKRFEDAEGVVIGWHEMEHNLNPATKDELGHTKRSSAKAGKVGSGMLGSFVVKDTSGRVFKVGIGWDQAERMLMWNKIEHFMGEVMTFKYQPYGTKDKPRIPIFKGWRHKDDC